MAKECFTKAISMGNLAAMHSMAFLQSTGFGGSPKDEAAALELEERAALAGYIPANMAMGYSYLHGLGGVPKDCERALIFYKVEVAHPAQSAV